jgi:phosphopantothenoylcysteine decarboxylase/phosphopantothenate--cysteine ligase
MKDNSKKPENLKVLLGVSGGIAAFKAAALASRLTGHGTTVKTIMTKSACELIMPRTFEAVTGQSVYTSLWNCFEEYKVGHINLAQWADIIVVAPATANIIGKMANGICDDLLSTVLCAAHKKPILIVPAMNNNMWENPAVRKNVKTLQERNCKFIGPETGRLACGTEAVGRMSEPQDIIEAIKKISL